MRMPGFTAEASLQQTNNHYRMVGTVDALTSSRQVLPQAGNWPWEYGAYAACFYGCWGGGGDPVTCGDDCKQEWLG